MKVLSDLNPKLEDSIVSVVEEGNILQTNKDHQAAQQKYQAAWDLLPAPQLDWEIASWIASCLYSVHFECAAYAEAKKWAEISLKTRSSDIDTAPLIDLGMVCHELGQNEEAYAYFHDAYRYGKKRAFRERPKKYLDFYLNHAATNPRP
ncbi:MAG: hypothetical protein ABN482_15220 [Corticimicrobacter sp.]|uniref:hypothetical protein n=1 Tax=Corticimicrobacter sp. TaxID=2678536 RepID=UPI0032DBDADE